ncbi:uncharacterized protein LOC107846703 [Capsicum annuum]|uniref:uncharacterized protein LOC107846703 n=1 Tax=Capsicum annuum TaxID=4072 RepID=UPI001FB09B3C|nr:uncharacterized protein LOC107846703 [Capsicum annuum]
MDDDVIEEDHNIDGNSPTEDEKLALEQMPRNAKFMKDLVTKKWAVIFEAEDNLHHCKAIATRYLVQKKMNPGMFTIPCTIGPLDFAKALCDLRESINIMPLVIYKKLGLVNPTPTNMRLIIADRSLKWPVGILYDVLVKVINFIFPADFVILDYEVDFEVPIILGRPFLATGSVIIALRANKLLFRLNDEIVCFDVCQSMKQPKEMSVLSIVDDYYKDDEEVSILEKVVGEPLAAVLMNLNSDSIESYKETSCALNGIGPYSCSGNTLPIIIADGMSEKQVEALISVLQ